MTRTNTSAWTRGGTAVEAGSASEAAQQAGLDWNVMLADMQAYVKNEVNPYETVTDYYPVPRKQAVIKLGKENDNQVIGVVGDKYKVVQNMEVFSALDSLVDSGDARYTAAGEYNNGANIWMIMELPIGVNVANDPHAAFLLIQSSHDGSCSVRIRPIIERLFCRNQINRLITGKKTNDYTYVMKHTTNATLSPSEIGNIIKLSYDSIEQYEQVSATLLSREASHARARDFFKRVWALPSTVEGKPYHMLTQGERRQQTIAVTARDKAFEIYSESPTQENIRGTAFGMWQAVVEYADHHASGGSERLAVSTLSGRNDKVKDKALGLILENSY
jgi:phage/plasmid-like protein (TIGR03299 family)